MPRAQPQQKSDLDPDIRYRQSKFPDLIVAWWRSECLVEINLRGLAVSDAGREPVRTTNLKQRSNPTYMTEQK